MASIGENYFEKYTADSAAEMLAGLPSAVEIQFEDDYLDLKAGDDWNAVLANPKDDKFKNKLKSAWSELIGQFANCGGGVVIWGIYMLQKERKLPVF